MEKTHTWALKNNEGLFYSGKTYDDYTDQSTYFWSESIDDAVIYACEAAAMWDGLVIRDYTNFKPFLEKIPWELIP